MTDEHNRLIEPEHEKPAKKAVDEEPVVWATKKQRIVAGIAAVVVILITLAFTYSIYTGDLFS
ncbi:MAG: hypothetical protein RR450_04405, partial [Oscillospiraceae bacterium]